MSLFYFPSISEGLDLVIEAIDRAGYNGRIKLALNVAATDFCVGMYFEFLHKFNVLFDNSPNFVCYQFTLQPYISHLNFVLSMPVYLNLDCE